MYTYDGHVEEGSAVGVQPHCDVGPSLDHGLRLWLRGNCCSLISGHGEICRNVAGSPGTVKQIMYMKLIMQQHQFAGKANNNSPG